MYDRLEKIPLTLFIRVQILVAGVVRHGSEQSIRRTPDVVEVGSGITIPKPCDPVVIVSIGNSRFLCRKQLLDE